MHYMNVTCKLHAYYPVARDPARDLDSDWPEAIRQRIPVAPPFDSSGNPSSTPPEPCKLTR